MDSTPKARMKTHVAVRDTRPHRFHIIPLRDVNKQQPTPVLKDRLNIDFRKQLKPVKVGRPCLLVLVFSNSLAFSNSFRV